MYQGNSSIYSLSLSLDITFVLETLERLDISEIIVITSYTIIHSDQGCHYTSNGFQKAVKDLDIIQSMSRRGNCWVNAPQESFFGHMKDELNTHKNISFIDLSIEIDDYMDYYNNYRYQWTLNRMSPSEYRIYLEQKEKMILI
ncbi:MAG: IS3 family transposase [Bacilli bacterium]